MPDVMRADEDFRALTAQLCQVAPELLGHVEPTRLLFIFGAARREARASIRPLTFGGSPPSLVQGNFIKPKIMVDGVWMLYEICFRPRFFLCATAQERLNILAHELWHISPAFDGALAEERRHQNAKPGEFDQLAIDSIVDRFLVRHPLPPLLRKRGRLEIRAWLSRPPSRQPKDASMRSDYDERDLYVATVEQT